ncbi:MAG: response regulator [Acetobacteraceae bacterium]|nr:response regulator [Acetobacteraceae bacterium]
MWAHLAAFALAIVLPLWGLLAVAAWTTVQDRRADLQQQTVRVARNLAQELDRELAGLEGLLRALATSPALADGDLARFHAQAMQIVPAGSAIVLRDRSGRALISTLFPYGTELPVTGAQAVLAADACVFSRAVTCLSDLYLGTTDRQPYVLLNTPVMRDGEVAFALNVAIRARHLAGMLAGYAVPSGWAVAILDREHRVVARSPEHDRFVGTPGNAALRARGEEAEGTVRTVNIAGVPVWGAFARLPNWGWRVAIGLPQAALDAPLRRYAHYLAGAALLAAAGSVLGALLLGRRLAEAIQALRQMAGEVGQSSVAAPAAATGVAEVDLVAASLAETDQRLRASLAERDRAEEGLRRLNEGLEARVATEIAAREEAQRRLAHAQRMEALGQIAGGIAHDFNNVLQAVGGGAALIQRKPGDPEHVARFARMVADAAERGSSITRRLLALSRRGDLRASAVDPRDLLAELQEVFRHTIGSGIDVRVEAPDALPPILVDKGQLEAVLVNLATNARDAMAGSGTLTLLGEAVGTAPGLPDGDYVRLAVRDTGCGMPPQVLARAPEPFFTTKPPGAGTGLGLAMARGFALQSGGGFAIESEPGRGTVVSLWLPVAQAAEGPAGGPGAMPAGAGRRVLVVDDEPLVREVTASGLEGLGFSVVGAGSGAEALGLLDAGEGFAVLICDLSMPGMDGLATIREAHRRRPGLPAILLTGFATKAAELAVGAEVPGRFALLRKPITAEALAEQIGMVLRGAPDGA